MRVIGCLRSGPALAALVGVVASVGTAAAPVAAQNGPLSRWAEWVRAVEPDDRVIRELGRYGGAVPPSLDEEYRRGLAVRVGEGLRDSARKQVARLTEGHCEPFLEVTYGTQGLPGAPASGPVVAAHTAFERGLVRVEAVSCLIAPGIEPAEALLLRTSPGFRMEVEPRLRAIREEGDESCVETSGVFGLLSPSDACNRLRRFIEGSIASEHSQVVSNSEAGSLQPIYLKESLKTFVAIPGGVALHYVNYSRSAEIGFMGRWAATRSIRDSEARMVDALQDRLTERDRVR